MKFNYQDAFCRNRGLITREEQEKLRNATIGIPGLGGVGGIHLMTLARMGVGGFHLADDDTFSIVNFNRQYGAKMSTLGRKKLGVMAEQVKDVNPEVRLKTWKAFISQKNVDEFLEDCDLVVDSLDAFATEDRRVLFMKAREMGIPVITAGPIGFSCALLVFTPQSMSFEKYFDYYKDTEEQFLKFIIGVTPKPYFLSYMNTKQVDIREQNGPSVASSVTLCAGFAGVEALKLLLGRGKVYPSPYYHYFDPFLMIFKRGYIPFGNRNPIQRIKYFILRSKLKDFWFLKWISIF